MAGFVDHVLGCVLYPLMQRGPVGGDDGVQAQLPGAR